MTLIEKIKDKVRVAFNSALTEDEKKALNEHQVKLEGELVAPVVAPVAPIALKDVTTKDGKKLSYEGELKEGVKISLVDPATGPSDAPDGTYELEDGTKISVSAGLVSKIETSVPAAPVAPEAPQMAAVVQQMETKFSAYKEERNKEIESLKQVQLATLKAFEKLQKTLDNLPIDTADLEAPAKKYEELTPAERYSIDHPIN